MARLKIVSIDKYTQDVERLSDQIYNDAQGKIIDRDTFDMHFRDFIVDRDAKVTHKQETILAPMVFDRMREKHPTISQKREFSEAGGKNLKQDQKKTAKVVVTDTKEFRKRTAQKVDMEGVDTKPIPRRFTFVGRVGGKVVKARKTIIIVNGKSKTIFRDRKGRFVSRKK